MKRVLFAICLLVAEFTEEKRHAFEPSGDGDWVLVLDEAAKNFSPPAASVHSNK